MDEEETEYVYKLQGRIMACEILNTKFLRIIAMMTNPADHLEGFDRVERIIMSGLQKFERPMSEESDLIWEAMSDAMRHTMEQARLGLEEADRGS
jgi:hypothetical protein